MSKLEFLDYNLNDIFTLSYNFETLKLMLGNISKNQHNLNQRLNDLESKDDESNKKQQSNVDNKETDQNNHDNSGNNNSSNSKIQHENFSSFSKKKHEIIPPLTDNILEEDNISQTDYNIRIKVLETKISKLYSLLSSSATQKELSNIEEDMQSKMNILYDKNNEVNNKQSIIESSLEELKVKVSDFNIYELLKGSNNIEEGSIDSSKILIQALENKIFKKFNLEDEKIKLLEKEVYKAKSDLMTLKNSTESINRSIPLLRNDITETKASIETLSNSTDDKISKLQIDLNNITNQFNQQIRTINDELKAINEANELDLKETDLNKEFAPTPNISGLVTEKEYKKFKEGMVKRLNEIERKYAILNDKCDLDTIYASIKSMNIDLNAKATHQELYNANDRVMALGDSLNSLTDDQNNIIDEIKKFKGEQNQIFKKMESIQSQLLLLKIGDNAGLKNRENSLLELSKYVEISTFNDFLKAYHKDNERMKRDNEDLKRNNDEMNEALKVKATEIQLNQLEEYLVSLIEEIKNTFCKKYADRIDTNKNFKSIETQIKHIIEVYIKRSDKGDNWLIAKKPIGGYSCASCENYIGDLNDKTEYLAWNKVHGKESFEKTYRVGNGFSHILNMMTLDKINKKEQTDNGMFESDNENSNLPHTMESKKKKHLPPLDANQNAKCTYTEGNDIFSDSGEDRKRATNYDQKSTEGEPKM